MTLRQAMCLADNFSPVTNSIPVSFSTRSSLADWSSNHLSSKVQRVMLTPKDVQELSFSVIVPVGLVKNRVEEEAVVVELPSEEGHLHRTANFPSFQAV